MKTNNVMLCMLIIILSSTVLFAQSATEKGRIIMDADFDINSGNQEIDDEWDTENDHSITDADIRVGYTVIDDLEIGVAIGMTNESTDTKNEFYKMKTTDNSMTYGVFARYFLMKEKALRPFVMVNGGMGTMKMTATGAEDQKYGMTQFGGGLGVVYFVNTHVGVELLGLYQMISITENDDHDFTSDASVTGFHIVLGTMVSF